jgi:hypothetical protein
MVVKYIINTYLDLKYNQLIHNIFKQTHQRKKLDNQCYLPAKADLVNLEHSKLAALYHG